MKRSKPRAVRVASVPTTDMDYRVHDAVHTLKRAEQIKADPKLHAAAKAHAKTEAAALSKIARKK